jgi:hypothetical protein
MTKNIYQDGPGWIVQRRTEGYNTCGAWVYMWETVGVYGSRAKAMDAYRNL